MVRAAALVLAAFGAVGGGPQQFDLICKGTAVTETDSSKRSEDYQRHYRVDLKSARWCQDECGAVRPIAEVQETYLRLEPTTLHRDGTTQFDTKISRTDGSETSIYMSDRSYLYFRQTDAKCEPGPFSGFPTFKKQF